MEDTRRRQERPTRSGRFRSALTSTAMAAIAVTACMLWAGVALPGMQLLFGTGKVASQSVSISLQSALLGIDDTTGRPPSASALAALHALGLTPTQQLLSHDLLRLRGASASGPLNTPLDPRALDAGHPSLPAPAQPVTTPP